MEISYFNFGSIHFIASASTCNFLPQVGSSSINHRLHMLLFLNIGHQIHGPNWKRINIEEQCFIRSRFLSLWTCQRTIKLLSAIILQHLFTYACSHVSLDALLCYTIIFVQLRKSLWEQMANFYIENKRQCYACTRSFVHSFIHFNFVYTRFASRQFHECVKRASEKQAEQEINGSRWTYMKLYCGESRQPNWHSFKISTIFKR